MSVARPNGSVRKGAAYDEPSHARNGGKPKYLGLVRVLLCHAADVTLHFTLLVPINSLRDGCHPFLRVAAIATPFKDFPELASCPAPLDRVLPSANKRRVLREREKRIDTCCLERNQRR